MDRIIDTVEDKFGCFYRIDKKLYEQSSEFQNVQIIENEKFGKMLVLDNNVQTTEYDDFMYHELLCHVPMLTHPSPQRVLIIGGGDGGLLKQTLRHPISHVTMIEIDKLVIDSVTKYIPSIPENSFSDSRTRLFIEDGIEFVRETTESFDIALVDSTDPEGPALGLFTHEFYGKLAHILGPDGVLAVQSGSPIYQEDMISLVRKNMAPHFKYLHTYLGSVLSYPGVFWTFTIGSQKRDPTLLEEKEILHRMQNISTDFYIPSDHKHLFVFPPFLKNVLV